MIKRRGHHYLRCPLFILALKTWSSVSDWSYMALTWGHVSKSTNSKHQIPNKSQNPILNDQNRSKKRTSNIELRTSNVELW